MINQLKKSSFKEIYLKYSYIFFDCDGVLWQSGKEIKGSHHTLNKLHQNDK